MRRAYFRAPDASANAVTAALQAAPFFPADRATVRVDAELGVVVVTTEAPWRADANGLEEGLGVPGWALLETETLDDNEAPAEVRAVDAVRSKLEALPEVVVGVAVPEEI